MDHGGRNGPKWGRSEHGNGREGAAGAGDGTHGRNTGVNTGGPGGRGNGHVTADGRKSSNVAII